MEDDRADPERTITGPVDLRDRPEPPLPLEDALREFEAVFAAFGSVPPPRERIELREPLL